MKFYPVTRTRLFSLMLALLGLLSSFSVPYIFPSAWPSQKPVPPSPNWAERLHQWLWRCCDRLYAVVW